MNSPSVLAAGQHQPPIDLDHSLTGAPETSGRLGRRLLLASAVLGAETIAVAAFKHPWLNTTHIATGPIAFLAALLFFGRKTIFKSELQPKRISSQLLLVHLFSVLAMLGFTAALLGSAVAHQPFAPIQMVAWYLSLALMTGTVSLSVLPMRQIRVLTRRLGVVWGYASVCAVLIVFARSLESMAWDAPDSAVGSRLAMMAFHGCAVVLRALYPNLIADPMTRVLGPPNFLVHVAGACSGIEGLALTLAFTTGWLLFERRNLRMSRAVWLIPVALVLIWTFNILRIAALVVIGAQGHAEIAVNGFHSEAGWIAFITVVVGFLLAANNIPWFQKGIVVEMRPFLITTAKYITEDASAKHITGEATAYFAPVRYVDTFEDSAPVAPYLLPFVLILATSLLTRAASSGFEYLYPLRLVAAVAVFYAYRKRYAAMRWSFAPIDLLSGIAIGFVWIAIATRIYHLPESGIATGLATLHAPGRAIWLLARVFAATFTVPVAEELAFRGYLARRLVGEHPEHVRYATLTLFSIAVSSVAFGAMHGALWPLGILAGAAFGLLARRGHSLGSAIAAHGAANFVLATWVLTHNAYSLW